MSSPRKQTHFKSRFATVDPGREITRAGAAYGANAVDRNVLEPCGDGETRVLTEESMSGPLLVLFFNSAKLKSAQEEWLTALKTAAEKR